MLRPLSHIGSPLLMDYVRHKGWHLVNRPNATGFPPPRGPPAPPRHPPFPLRPPPLWLSALESQLGLPVQSPQPPAPPARPPFPPPPPVPRCGGEEGVPGSAVIGLERHNGRVATTCERAEHNAAGGYELLSPITAPPARGVSVGVWGCYPGENIVWVARTCAAVISCPHKVCQHARVWPTRGVVVSRVPRCLSFTSSAARAYLFLPRSSLC